MTENNDTAIFSLNQMQVLLFNALKNILHIKQLYLNLLTQILIPKIFNILFNDLGVLENLQGEVKRVLVFSSNGFQNLVILFIDVDKGSLHSDLSL